MGAGLTGVGAGSSTMGDVNGDGSLEVLITGRTAQEDHTASLYLDDGQGGFSRAEAGLLGVSDGSSSFGYVNRDGHLDLLITGSHGGRSTVMLYLGDGQGRFIKADVEFTGVSLGASSIADVNEDGRLDLLLTGQNVEEEPTTTLYLGRGKSPKSGQ